MNCRIALAPIEGRDLGVHLRPRRFRLNIPAHSLDARFRASAKQSILWRTPSRSAAHAPVRTDAQAVPDNWTPEPNAFGQAYIKKGRRDRHVRDIPETKGRMRKWRLTV